MRYALRTLPTHPAGPAGDLIYLRGITNAEDADLIRQTFTLGRFMEVVRSDDGDEWQVVT